MNSLAEQPYCTLWLCIITCFEHSFFFACTISLLWCACVSSSFSCPDLNGLSFGCLTFVVAFVWAIHTTLTLILPNNEVYCARQTVTKSIISRAEEEKRRATTLSVRLSNKRTRPPCCPSSTTPLEDNYWLVGWLRKATVVDFVCHSSSFTACHTPHRH